MLPDHLVGRRGRCSKCGLPVEVPPNSTDDDGDPGYEVIPDQTHTVQTVASDDHRTEPEMSRPSNKARRYVPWIVAASILCCSGVVAGIVFATRSSSKDSTSLAATPKNKDTAADPRQAAADGDGAAMPPAPPDNRRPSAGSAPPHEITELDRRRRSVFADLSSSDPFNRHRAMIVFGSMTPEESGEELSKAILEVLLQDEGNLACSAIDAFVKSQHEQSLLMLAELMKVHESPKVRAYAARRVGNIPVAKATQELQEYMRSALHGALQDEDDDVVSEAIAQLETWGNYESTLPVAKALDAHPTSGPRLRALQTLSRMPPFATDEVRTQTTLAVARVLSDPHTDVAGSAFHFLKTRGSDACIPIVLSLLRNSTSYDTQQHAMELVGRFPSEEGAQILLKRLAGAATASRSVQGEVLAKMGGFAEAALVEALSDPDHPNKEELCRILGKLDLPNGLAPQTVSALLNRIRVDDSLSGQAAIFQVLGKTRDEHVAKALMAEYVRGGLKAGVLSAIKEMGPVAEPVLLKYLKEQHPENERRPVIETLGHIGSTKSLATLHEIEQTESSNRDRARRAVEAIRKRSDKPDTRVAGVSAKPDKTKLDGKWRFISVREYGKTNELPENLSVTIANNTLIWQIADEPPHEITFTLDASRFPKRIDLTEGSHTSLGIYDLIEDKLYICHSNEGDVRATAFESRANSENTVLLVLMRK
jgi:uncharacterized protein (TIGR03067 family)